MYSHVLQEHFSDDDDHTVDTMAVSWWQWVFVPCQPMIKFIWAFHDTDPIMCV